MVASPGRPVGRVSRLLHIDRSQHLKSPLRLNLAITSYLLSLAVFIPVSGWVADHGRRRHHAEITRLVVPWILSPLGVSTQFVTTVVVVRISVF